MRMFLNDSGKQVLVIEFLDLKNAGAIPLRETRGWRDYRDGRSLELHSLIEFYHW